MRWEDDALLESIQRSVGIFKPQESAVAMGCLCPPIGQLGVGVCLVYPSLVEVA